MFPASLPPVGRQPGCRPSRSRKGLGVAPGHGTERASGRGPRMEAHVRRKLEMAARVREFSLANPSEEPSYAIVLGRFEKLLDRAAEFAAQQRAGLIAVRAASASRAGLRHELQSKFLRHLVGVGMVAAKDRAEPDNQFQLPRGNASHLVFLTAVKGMLAKAEEQKEALVSQGMSVGLLEDLGKSVASFEAANQASIGGRRAHVGARAGLRTVADAGLVG